MEDRSNSSSMSRLEEGRGEQWEPIRRVGCDGAGPETSIENTTVVHHEPMRIGQIALIAAHS
jgi:hypothetical protein